MEEAPRTASATEGEAGYLSKNLLHPRSQSANRPTSSLGDTTNEDSYLFTRSLFPTVRSKARPRRVTSGRLRIALRASICLEEDFTFVIILLQRSANDDAAID